MIFYVCTPDILVAWRWSVPTRTFNIVPDSEVDVGFRCRQTLVSAWVHSVEVGVVLGHSVVRPCERRNLHSRLAVKTIKNRLFLTLLRSIPHTQSLKKCQCKKFAILTFKYSTTHVPRRCPVEHSHLLPQHPPGRHPPTQWRAGRSRVSLPTRVCASIWPLRYCSCTFEWWCT